MDITELLAATREAAKRGGEVALQVVREGLGAKVVGKGMGGDYSLQGDVESERRIIETLLMRLGAIKVISEEIGEKILGEEPEFTAIVDPIDGSRNYKRGLPFFSVSVAVAKGETLRDIVAATIYAPLLNLEFTAIRGGGAFLNEKPIRVTRHESLQDSLIFVGSSPKATFLPHLFILNIVSKGAIVRSLGSASLELSFVASGAADAYIDYWGTMRVVDIAAAYLIAKEAGAWVSIKGFIRDEVALSIQERLLILASSTQNLGKELHSVFGETFGMSPDEIYGRG